MILKKTLKLIKSLQLKKYRYQEQLFLVEGAKSIIELLSSSLKVETLIGTTVFVNHNKSLIDERISTGTVVYQATEAVISSISSYKNNNAGVAVVSMPKPKAAPKFISGYGLLLDNIRDPGNLGTIIRIADWYNIAAIICSPETTDEFNPKVISASMGSFLRVPIYRAELPVYLQRVELPVYCTFVDQGISVHELDFASQGLILLGNESEGVSKQVEEYVTQAVQIPRFGEAESLNVSIATAVICDNLRRGAARS